MPTRKHITIDLKARHAAEKTQTLTHIRASELTMELAKQYKIPTSIEIKNWNLLAAMAREKILRHWLKQSQQFISNVGMPSHRDAPIYRSKGRYCMDFGGATLSTLFSKNDDDINVTPTRRVQVTFQGYGLEQRQEKGDELYGVLTGNIGSLGYTKHWDLAEEKLGPASNNRISQHAILMHEGAPMDLNIVFAMIERDHGNMQKIRNQIKEALNDAVKEAASLATAAAGSANKSVKNKFDAQSLASSNLYKWALGGAAALITWIFGLKDDPYNPGTFMIPAADMLRIPPVREYRCAKDPRVLRYTHRITVQGRDDGGDLGVITALFLVRAV